MDLAPCSLYSAAVKLGLVNASITTSLATTLFAASSHPALRHDVDRWTSHYSICARSAHDHLLLVLGGRRMQAGGMIPGQIVPVSSLRSLISNRPVEVG